MNNSQNKIGLQEETNMLDTHIDDIENGVKAEIVNDLLIPKPKIELPKPGECINTYYEMEKVKQDIRDYLKVKNPDPNYLPSIHSDPIIDHQKNLFVCTDTHEVGFYTYKDGKICEIETGCKLLPDERLYSISKQGNKYFVRKATYNKNGRIDDTKTTKIIFDEDGHKEKEVGKDESISYIENWNVYVGEKATVEQGSKWLQRNYTVYDQDLHILASDIKNEKYIIQGIEDGKVILLLQGFGTKYAIADISGIVEEKDMNIQQKNILSSYLQKKMEEKEEIYMKKKMQDCNDKQMRNYEYHVNQDGNVVIRNNSEKEIFIGGSINYLGNSYMYDDDSQLRFANPNNSQKYYKLNKYETNKSPTLMSISECDLSNHIHEKTIIINKETGERMSVEGVYSECFINGKTVKKFTSGNTAEIYNDQFVKLGSIVKEYDNLHSVHVIGKHKEDMQLVSYKTGELLPIHFKKVKKIYQKPEYDVFIVSDLDDKDQEIIVEK